MRLILACWFVLVSLCGCAVFSPYVSSDEVEAAANEAAANEAAANEAAANEAAANEAAADAQLGRSLTRAHALQEVLEKKAQDYYRFDQVSGILLIGAGVTAAAFGILDGPRDAILASALAGGGVAGVRAFVPSVARQGIYLQGAQAVNCVEVVARLPEPLVTAPAGGTRIGGGDTGVGLTASLQGTLATSALASGSLSLAVERLNQTSRGLTNQPSLSAATSIAALQGTRLMAATSLADSAVAAALAQAPSLMPAERLDLAVDGIRLAVNSAILNTSVDARSALESALSEVSGITQQAKAAYQTARDTVQRKKDKAKETSDDAEEVADKVPPDSAARNDALELQGAAEQIEKNAEDQLEILDTVLGQLDKRSEKCAGQLR